MGKRPDETNRFPMRPWHWPALAVVLALALFLHLFRLEQEGYANAYYAAAVKSMLSSWHNFFFISFDPAGFVTVDKPPLGLWVQAASAALLGFRGTSLLLPQALAGVLSVLLLFQLVRRTFGPTAGLVAALVLAVTPISVAANRNNTMDGQLVLVLLLAAWAVLLATERNHLGWLFLGAALVGVGFNIKMLQAYMVLPAFFLVYLLGSSIRWWKRLLHLALATLLLVAVSLSWAVAVDLTSPEERPYVGSSQTNSVLELIVGHNGASRLLPGGLRGLLGQGGAQPGGPGQRPGGPGRQPGGPGQPPPPPPGGGGPRPAGGPSPAVPPSGGGQRPFSQETGEPGLFRLFTRQLAGQVSWLLPLAGLGLLAAAWQERLRLPLGRRHSALLLWIAWLLPQMAFFSMANLFHRYYLEMLSPAVAALVGAGLVAMWGDLRRGGWKAWLLPLALVLTAALEVFILAEFPDYARRLSPLVVGLTLPAAGALIAIRLFRPRARPAWLGGLTTVGLLALLLPLLVWSLLPVLYGGEAHLPYAGPELLEQPRRQGQGLPQNDRLIAFLEANHQGETFLLAVLNANTAAPMILETGEPVMALGGFSGSDPILTAEELEALVAAREVRFFLLPQQGRAQQDLLRWVVGNCRAVPEDLWGEAGGPAAAGPGGGGPLQLWDCAGRAAAVVP